MSMVFNVCIPKGIYAWPQAYMQSVENNLPCISHDQTSLSNNKTAFRLQAILTPDLTHFIYETHSLCSPPNWVIVVSVFSIVLMMLSNSPLLLFFWPLAVQRTAVTRGERHDRNCSSFFFENA